MQFTMHALYKPNTRMFWQIRRKPDDHMAWQEIRRKMQWMHIALVHTYVVVQDPDWFSQAL